MLPLAASILGLMPAAAPQAVSFSAGLLTASAGPLLRRLRVAGVSHLAAVQLDPDACDALLDGGELDVLLGVTPRGEPDALSPEIQAALAEDDLEEPLAPSVKRLGLLLRRWLLLREAAAAEASA